MATAKKYWKGIGEINNEVSTAELAATEFNEALPTADFLENDQLESTSTTRRDFLKFMGFSTAAATLAACEAPVQKSIPYVVKPEEVIPGVASYYASMIQDGFDFAPVLVKVREGRPIKIEANDQSALGKGTSARVQASVLSLYDSNRAQNPTKDGNAVTWEEADADIISSLESASTKGLEVAVVTNSVVSPSLAKLMSEFKRKYATTEVYEYDAVSFDGILSAHEQAFGVRAIPFMNLEHAQVIVGIGSDFLGTDLNFGNESAYAKGRDPRKGQMSKHFQFESNLSLTGANADERFRVTPAEQHKVLVDLYNAVAGAMGRQKLPGGGASAADAVAKVADALLGASGKSVIRVGSNHASAQAIALELNRMLGAYDHILDMNQPLLLKKGKADAMAQLTSKMASGKVGVLLVHGVNPLYASSDRNAFSEALKNVDTKIYSSLYADESAAAMNFVLPANHFLESWGDAEYRTGHFALSQPVIQPLYNSRSLESSMLTWMGASNTDAYACIRGNWENTILNGASWNQVLHDGVYSTDKTAPISSTSLDLTAGARDLSQMKTGAYQLELYLKTGIADGKWANNPWLQELPDPISRTSWDNYLTISASDARELGLSNRNVSNGALNGSLANITVNGVTVSNVPVLIQPGQASGSVGLALGYGRTMAGKVADGVGVDAWPLYLYGQHQQVDVTIEPVEGEHEFACIQLAHTMMGRSIVKETTLAEFIADPKAGNPEIHFETIRGEEHVSKVNLWDEFDKTTGHWWNLSIDLNSCIGCGACVVACQAENNTSVVGKEEMRKSRDMYWLRIDRYYSSDMDKDRAKEENIGAIDMYASMEEPSANPEVVFQPVMCQHCNHAPCETVCPVAATSHSLEGLNHMAYNRCIGTRYCANNCPYKVRRFNWFNYTGNDQFADVNPAMDDMGKMVLNPDVTVRARGVMEKCSMCIQKIQLGKLEAKREGRPLNDGEIQTACAGACSTGAIVFGDFNDKESEVAKLAEEPRAYHLLEEVGTRPSVFYHTKVRNKA